MQFNFFKQEKIGINNLSIIIEPTFFDTFSILAFDELNIIWIEKFTETEAEAEIIAEKLFIKAKKQLLNGYN
jgi:hypothetical protein